MRTRFTAATVGAFLLVTVLGYQPASADDYQVQWTPGGTYVYDSTPKQSPNVVSDATITSLMIMVAQSGQAAQQFNYEHGIDRASLFMCGGFATELDRYYRDGNHDITDLNNQPITAKEVKKAVRRWPFLAVIEDCSVFPEPPTQ